MKSVTNRSQVTHDDLPLGVLPVDLVADGVQQVGLAQADAAVDEQRVPLEAGASATMRAAAWANWLVGPTTNLSKV